MARINGAKPPTLAEEPTSYGNVQKPIKTHANKKLSPDYTSEGVKDNDVFLLPVTDYTVMFGLTILSAIIRLFRIYQPTSVVFDEVHFGGFASKYIKGKFFMDVHPPLAKLLITLAGWLAGFDGEFDFKDIGKDYLEPGVPYVAMRMFPAVCGILLAPTMFLTLKAAGCRTFTSAMGAGLIIFENGLLTQARLILLDSPLMITTAFTALAFVSFTNQHELGPSKAFEPSWWFWLVATGLGLGATLSIKWVGLFTIAWVGSLTLLQLWVLLGDTKTVTIRVFAKHFMARAFALIVIPSLFYLGMFAIHFLVLRNPGEGDGFMSSEFQSTFNSKAMGDVPADVLLGSKVSIRHVNTQGGYLHSHPLMYPTGSKQQQITLYPHKDDNNIWLLENQTQPLDIHGEPINGTNAWDSLEETPYIVDGSVLRIFHQPTQRRLHSHDVRPPVTEAEWQNEVSAYGYEGFDGDANDYFKVEIIKHKSKAGPAQTRLRTIETKFRLVHIMTGCVLFSHKVKLPEWASEQQEVTCAKGGTLPNSLWYIEHNEHPSLGAEAEKVNYDHLGFFKKFLELNAVMWRTNQGLTESHSWDSRPPSWPILSRGINFWGKDNRQIYLIGNPVIWWSSTLAVVIYVLFKGLAVIRWQRQCNDYSNTLFKRFDYEIGTSVLGWAFHYFPFYLMARQLFLHHYFPALYFAIMAFCQVFDFATARVSVFGIKNNSIINKTTTVGFLLLSAAVFTVFAPLAYGNTWTKTDCARTKLLPGWDYDCNTFLDSYAQYPIKSAADALAASQTPQAAIPSSAPGGQAGQVAAAAADEASNIAAQVSQAPLVDENNQRILAREEKIEYRDQDGNLLDEEQVKSLEGKVEFKTRYETRTRLVDESGNEIHDYGAQPDAPQAEVEAEKASTKSKPAVPVVGSDGQVVQEKDGKVVVEKSVEGESEARARSAKPASEAREASA